MLTWGYNAAKKKAKLNQTKEFFEFKSHNPNIKIEL